MLLELAIVIILGILAGTITGLLPGIHINLIASILIASLSLSFISSIAPFYLAIFIISLALTHTCVDFIPSIYLGAPDEDTYLTILPGHELLKQGKAHEAIVLAMLGIILGTILSLLFIPIYIFISPIIETQIIKIVAFTLIAISLFMIFREDRVLTALVVFALAGFLGYSTLNLPIKEPLLPLLTGLFGTSSILLSMKNKTKIIKQEQTKIQDIQIDKKEIKKSFLGALFTLPLFSILPALGSGYAALTASETLESLNKKISQRGFIILTGTINASIMISSFFLVYTINKARTGASAALEKLVQSPSLEQLIIAIISIFIIMLIASSLTLLLSKKSSQIISKINYRLLSLVVIIVILFFVFMISGLVGILVLLTSTSLGIFAILSKIKRTHLMSSLIIPTILYYLFF